MEELLVEESDRLIYVPTILIRYAKPEGVCILRVLIYINTGLVPINWNMTTKWHKLPASTNR